MRAKSLEREGKIYVVDVVQRQQINTQRETDDERLLSNGNQGLVAVAGFIYGSSSSG